MNKELKKKLIKNHEENKAAFPRLYDLRWVENAATKGFKDLTEKLEKVDPRLGAAARQKQGYNVLAVIYYTAFENALNTFFHQCMEDTMQNVDICLDELQNITATIRQEESV